MILPKKTAYPVKLSFLSIGSFLTMFLGMGQPNISVHAGLQGTGHGHF
jgi:hypothetical protein